MIAYKKREGAPQRDGKITRGRIIHSGKEDTFKYKNFNLILDNQTDMIVVFDGEEHIGGFGVGGKYGDDIGALDYLADEIKADYDELLEEKELVDYIQRMVTKTRGRLRIGR